MYDPKPEAWRKRDDRRGNLKPTFGCCAIWQTNCLPRILQINGEMKNGRSLTHSDTILVSPRFQRSGGKQKPSFFSSPISRLKEEEKGAAPPKGGKRKENDGGMSAEERKERNQ